MVIRNKESGHAVFYTLVIFPFTMLLTWAYVNISTWNSMRDALQTESARLAADLTRMPIGSIAKAEYESLVTEGLKAKYPKLTNLTVQTSVIDQISTVTIKAKLLQALNLGMPQASFEISRSASSQLIPGDYALIMSDGDSLRPALLAPDGSKWSSWESSYFPPANTFSFKKPPRGTSNDALWKSLWETSSYQNWATQACFNPAFSPLKFAAISLANALSSLPTNRLEILLTPGNDINSPYDIVRAINHSPSVPAGFTKNNITGKLSTFNDPLLPGAYTCALFSSAEHDLLGNYSLTDTIIESDYLNSDAASSNTSLNIIDSPLKDPANINIYQAIYWDIAKRNLPFTSGTPNIVAALEAAFISITSAIKKEDSETRGSLALAPIRNIYILSDNLTNLAQFFTKTRLEYLKTNKLFVNIIAWKHLYLSKTDKERLENELIELNRLSANNNLSLFSTSSAEELIGEIVPLLITKAQNVSFHDYEQR